MKNLADSSVQSLPLVDRDHNTLTLARSLALIDVGLKLVAVMGIVAGAVESLLYGIALLLPLATAAVIWGMSRGPLLASFGVLAVGAAFAASLGPAVGLLGAMIFWGSYLSALQVD